MVTCPYCGSQDVDGPDGAGYYQCLNCDAAWHRSRNTPTNGATPCFQ